MSIGNNCFIAYSDGAEVQNLSRMQINSSLWNAILHTKDYDGDGIPDGYELATAYWAFKHDTSAYENGSYLNPTNSSDIYLDFDNDTLSNIEEYRRDPQGDFDGDGTPDIYDKDDDNDSILTSVELQNHLNPYNPLDALGDLDHDGLSNLFESKHGLNIQDADTDHDGIDDGEELNYWNVTRGLDMDTAISYCKIPDVDGDNITDGKEIKGYDVKIITGWKSDGTPISEMRYISPKELDPLTPYANSTGVWLDTDKDGIPDIAESMLSNRSLWSKFRTEYSELWNNYSWVPSYFWTLYGKDLGKNHNSTSALENATNEIIYTATAIIGAGILVWMSYLTIKSVLSMSLTDIVAGGIGMTNEIFIGFLTADAIYELSDMAQQYFESLLHGIASYQGGG